MSKPSFAAGLVVGAVVTIGATISIPGLVPVPEGGVSRRAPREVVRDVVREVVREMPAEAPGAGAAKQPEKQAEETLEEMRAREVRQFRVRRIRANEVAAIATLRNIISAQAQFQSTARADENENGVGEYGCFLELSGAVGVRGGKKLNPPVLSSAFRKVENGRVQRNGYYYRIYLARVGGDGIPERDATGFLPLEVDPGLAETTWCCYAWPVEHGVTGERAFFTSQWGDIIANEDREYEGEKEPPPYAAYKPDSRGITGETAIDTLGGDRGEWKQMG